MHFAKAAFLLSLLTYTSALPGAAQGSLRANDNDCPSAHIIAVRATGESPDPGFGEMKKIIDVIISQVKGADAEAIVYPAAGIDPKKNPPEVSFRLYNDSETQGIESLKDSLRSYRKSCPTTPLALLGYSQGAQVVGDVLCGRTSFKPIFPFLPTEPIEQESVAQVKAIIQLGDPTNIANLEWHTGSAPITALSNFFPRQGIDACKQFGSFWRSYCDAFDVFCTQGLALQPHLKYVQKYGDEIATYVAGLLNAAISGGDDDVYEL